MTDAFDPLLVTQAVTQTFDPVAQRPMSSTEAPTTAPSGATSAPAPKRRESNFRMEVPYTGVLSKADEGIESTVMPSGSDVQIRKALKDTPNISRTLDADTQQYVGVINAALETLPFANGLAGVADREDGMFVQQVVSQSGNLAAYTPKFKKKEGVKYTGDSARNLIRSAMKLGTVYSVPLWHSGFWITLRSPSEGDLLELYKKIAQEKISLGRTTYGLLFSNISVYTSKALLDFVVDNLYDTSLNLKDNEDIRNYIRLPDLSLIIWALACATWPNGFQYQRACITDIDKCKHIVTEKLNLSRLLWTDTTSLTEKQIQHMTNRQRGSMEPDAIKTYVSDFMRGNKTKVDLTDELSFILEMPSAAAHIDAGYRWITQIEENYGRAMMQDEKSRNDYLLSQAQATSMRQYAHCVTTIVVGDDEIDGVEEIENALNDLTARDDIREAFMKKIAGFLDNSIISFVGIPTYTCPACGGTQRHSHEGEKYPELIPIDVAQTFFPLLVQKILRIQER